MSTPLTRTETDSAQASHLCTRCGLCCMGVIHNAAVLDEDEVEPARVVGLPVLDRPGRPGFALPCPKLAGTSCSIFGERPRVCGRYMCQVLVDHEEGRLSFDEANARVRCAHGLLERVKSLLPEGTTVGRAKALAQKPGEGADDNHLRLAAIALELYIDKHFRKPKEGTALVMKSV